MNKTEQMNKTEIIELSIAEGFHRAEIIDTEKIVFDSAFRPYCEENLCGQYGANYSCSPDCGTPEQMKQKVLAHKKALVVSTEWEIEDFSQTDKLKEAKSLHNAAMLRVIKKLKDEGHNGIMIGASGCSLCKPCKLASGEPCAFPDMMYSCMSAYCIWVKKLAEDCKMNYDYKDKIYCGNELGDSALLNMFANRFHMGRFEVTDRSIKSEEFSLRRQAIIKKLNSIKAESDILCNGSTIWLDNSCEERVVSFARECADGKIVFVGNITPEECNVEVDVSNLAGEILVESKNAPKIDGNSLNMPKFSYVVVKI